MKPYNFSDLDLINEALEKVNEWNPDKEWDEPGADFGRTYRDIRRYGSYERRYSKPSYKKSYGPKTLEASKYYKDKPAKTPNQMIYFIYQILQLMNKKVLPPSGVTFDEETGRNDLGQLISALTGNDVIIEKLPISEIYDSMKSVIREYYSEKDPNKRNVKMIVDILNKYTVA